MAVYHSDRMLRPRLPYLRSTLLAVAAGLALRLWFIHHFGQVQGDSIIYGDIAANWLRHGVYGFSSTTAGGVTTVAPTLIRLPGYPAFLAVIFRVFGIGNFLAVLLIQAVLDLATCLLIAAFVRRAVSPRAGEIALWLAALCPFTANYTAVPLTETLSTFCVALAFYAFPRLIAAGDARLQPPTAAPPPRSLSPPAVWPWVLLSAFAWSFSALLRPEGALLAVVLWVALIAYRRRPWGMRRVLAMGCAIGVLSILPFIPWTVRNWRTFHLFQPLAPRSAADPGDKIIQPGFDRWVNTWIVDFASVYQIGWNVPGYPVNFGDLPSRAFDSPAQYEQTRRLFEQYNRDYRITPELDAEFGRLAAVRIHTHPLRYYLRLPMLRVADMWLRPRTATMNLEPRWWQYSLHRQETLEAGALAALNLAYLAAALLGALQWKPFRGAMVGYVLVRSLLLLTAGPEPRYTLECFPVVLAFAAFALDSRGILPFRGPVVSNPALAGK